MELTSAGSPRRRAATSSFIGLLLMVGGLAGCEEGFTLSRPDQMPVLTVLSAGEAISPAGEPLLEPVVVKATTEGGQPIWGQAIRFEVTSGGGSVSVGEATTNQSGLVESEWTLGPATGWQEVQIRAGDRDHSVIADYRVRALPPGPYTLHLSPASLELSSPGNSAQLTAEVRSEADEPIDDVPISWTSTAAEVATVSEDGLVEAVAGGEGYAVASFLDAIDSTQVRVGGDELPEGETGGSMTVECGDAEAAWIWCDDFEQNRTGEYFEYADTGGSFVRADGVGMDGSYGMKARFGSGQVSAGSLKLAFGRTPGSYFRAVDAGTANYRDIYWRVFVRYADDWVGGGGDKMSRVTVLARSDWSQAMIGHVWSGRGEREDYLMVDPASGTDTDGSLITSGYNDFGALRWLGAKQGNTPLFASNGEWHCVEARVRLNDSGSSNGVFEMWINGELDARITNMNWLGRYSDYGMNAVFLENYWNAGSPRAQERYFDRFVVSTERIGC